jgi:hypothetical protein
MPAKNVPFFPKEATDDTFFSFANWDADEVIFGIPHAYLHDQARGHAVFIDGVVPGLTNTQVANLFGGGRGRVKKVVVLIDMESQQVARWLIMSSFEEAFNVLQEWSGKYFGAKKINSCWAFPPNWVVARKGRNLQEIRNAQATWLCEASPLFNGAMHELSKNERRVDVLWHDNLIETRPGLDYENSTVESMFCVVLDEEENLDQISDQTLVTPSTQVILDEETQRSGLHYQGDDEGYQGKGKEKAADQSAEYSG